MKKVIVVLCLLVLAAVSFGGICERPPFLNPADVPFSYDTNIPVIDCRVLMVGGNYTFKLPACDDTNEPYAIVGAGLPAGATIRPADWQSWGKYLSEPNQVEYYLDWVVTEKNIGVNYFSFQIAGKYHTDPNDWDWAAIVVSVDPNAGGPPIIQKPVKVPFGSGL